MAVLPRFIRLKDAPGYLGMDRNRFNVEVRPQLTEIPIGTQGIAFDRLELDRWADQYVKRYGRSSSIGVSKQCERKQRACTRTKAGSGTSTKESEVYEFEKVLAQVKSRKLKAT